MAAIAPSRKPAETRWPEKPCSILGPLWLEYEQELWGEKRKRLRPLDRRKPVGAIAVGGFVGRGDGQMGPLCHAGRRDRAGTPAKRRPHSSSVLGPGARR